MNHPTILVTGNKGFIGSRVISYLQEMGYNVIGINEDIRDIEALRPHFKNIEFVVHTAGKKYNAKDEKDYYTINVLGTKNVADLCLENNSKLIHLSSSAIDGPYGISKQRSQKLIEEYSTNKGLKTIILRLCSICSGKPKNGKRQYPLEKLVEDIENIIKVHNFNEFKLFTYPKT